MMSGDADKSVAEYAMALDLLGRMTDCRSEQEAIERVLDLFTMLFSPGKISFIRFMADPADPLVFTPLHSEPKESVVARLTAVAGLHAWTRSEKGFVFKLNYNDVPMGIMELDDLLFAQYREPYLNQALAIGDVCGLVIENAVRFEKINNQKQQLAGTLKTLKKTQAQLVESEKMAALGTLVAGVAHEINTPVGICVTAVSHMMDRVEDLDQSFHAKKMKRSDLVAFMDFAGKNGSLVLKNLHRAADLIHSFKQVSVDQISEKQRRFKLGAYVKDVIASLAPRLEEKEIDISCRCDDTITVRGYPGLYAQIITNLVLNSFIHGFRGRQIGKIDISIEYKKHKMIIEYRDDGAGMDHDTVARVFDPFFSTCKEVGTGLGMNIVYNIITRKLHGTIACTSVPEEGVLFQMTIPHAQEKIDISGKEKEKDG